LKMFDLYICNIVGSTEKQHLEKGVISVILHHFIPHIPPAAPEAAHLDMFRPVQKMPQKETADGSCEIFKPGKLSLFKHAENNIVTFLYLLQKLRDLRR